MKESKLIVKVNTISDKIESCSSELKIDDVPGGSEAFYDAASPDTYFIHPWPRGNIARASCLDLLKRLHNVKSGFATVTSETVQLVWMIMGGSWFIVYFILSPKLSIFFLL
ncbi:hypothetical protein BDC45DRAFT_562686 [Circinella umbellata]|nr:hypothetical protein BDC45DRAFT_562686 [Circinella umbellata]